ncbi:MAG: pitrilysin family protein [Patescibacteria group bacterium]
MFKKTELDNGTRLILAPRQETEAVTFLVLFGVGSRYEQKKINGVSHFLEHLVFKGTKKRPNTLDIVKELDGVGAEYNAFTGKDHTGYYVKVDARHIDLAIDIISDIIHNSLFDPKEIERERQVIVEEINMYEDNPMMYMEDLFEQVLYGANSLGRTIAGPRETVLNIKRADIVKHHEKFYRPDNTVIAVAGKLSERSLQKKINRAFSKKAVKGKLSQYTEYKKFPKNSRVSVMKKKTEQIQLAIGFPGFSYGSQWLYPSMVLATILGGNMSSRLFIRIRERMGLCYFIKADLSPYQDTGSFYIRAGLAKDKIDEAIQAIWQELTRVKDKKVTSVELSRAKEYLSGKLLLSLEDSDAVAQWLGRQMILTGKIETTEEKLRRIRKVTREEVYTTARKIFKQSAMALAIIGPEGSPSHYHKMIKRL